MPILWRNEIVRRAVRPIFALVAATALALLPGAAAQAGDAKVHGDVSLYFMGAGMAGNVTVKGIESDVDMSFGDIIDKLEFGMMGRARVTRDKWWGSADVIYMSLGAEKKGSAADLAQWMVQPEVGYDFTPGLAGFAGFRYNSLSGDVTGPLGRNPTGTVDWWDPVIGARGRYRFGERASLVVTGDIAPFKTASDFSWQLEPLVDWRFGDRWSAQAGYRWLYTDYSEGTGANEFRYKVTTQGPQAGATFHF